MRNPKQLFPLFSYFLGRKERKKELTIKMSRGIDSIRASSRSRYQRIAISDSSVYLPEWWKSRIKTIKGPLQHYVQQNLNVVSDILAIARDWPDHSRSLRTLLRTLLYVPLHPTVYCYCLGTERHRELHQPERVFPESLNVYSRFENERDEKKVNSEKVYIFEHAFSFEVGTSIDFSRFLLRQKLSVSQIWRTQNSRSL